MWVHTLCCLMTLLVAPLDSASPDRGQGELIERTLAIVAGQVVTLADVRTARALGLVSAADDLNASIERLVERALILREVDRYVPPEPPEAAIGQRLDELRTRLGDAEFERVLTAGGFTEPRLRAWIRDDLRMASYLNQRFSAAVGPSRADLIADWIADLRRRTTVVELWKKD
jgi:hypothetical protein